MSTPSRTELLDLLSAFRGRTRGAVAADILRADEILDQARWCATCTAPLEDDNVDDRACFACQGAPEL